MAVNTILNSVSSALAQQSAAVSVRSATTSAPTDNATKTSSNVSYTSPPSTVLQNANLLNTSSGFSQLSSLLEVAQSGTEQVGSILQQLQALAQQASSGGDATGLDSEFQQLLSQLDQTVSGTTFGGTNLLDGTLSAGSNSSSASGVSSQNIPSLSLPNLSSAGLFGGNAPTVTTAQDAASAASVLAGAQHVNGSASDAISAVLSQLNFASASVNSVISNTTAASSTLTESDLNDAQISGSFAGLLSKPSATAHTQTANLPSSLLSLLQE